MILAAGNALAGQGFPPWERTNPGGGGAFNAMAGGPTGILLAASDLSGAYLSRDGGKNWEVIGASRGLTVTHVSGLGFDPENPAIMYLGTESGLFRSADSGRQWMRVLDQGYITDIAIAASNPVVGYAAFHSRHDRADGRIYKTLDRGVSWQPVSGPSLPDGLHILELLVHGEDENRLYALAGEGRFACGPAALYESTDGGLSWAAIAADLGQIAHVVLDPRDHEALYVTTYGDIWDSGYRCIEDDPQGGYLYQGRREREGNWRWRQLTHENDLGRRNLWVWPDEDDAFALRVIDMDYPQIWESLDQGGSWDYLGSKDDWNSGWTSTAGAYGGSFNGDAKTLGRDLSDPDALLWVDGQFLWATRDDGRSFVPLFTEKMASGYWRSRGADNIVPFDMAFDADGRHLYLALADLGCFRSGDGGQSWQNCNQASFVGAWEGDGGDSMTVAADPDRPGVVWITQAGAIESEHQLLRSEDYGASWQAAGTGLPGGIPSGLSLDAHSPVSQRILFITVDGDVYRSDDDGWRWTRVLACGGCRYTAVDAFNRNLVYAGGEAGLWRSAKGGAAGSWTKAGLPEMSGSMGVEFWDHSWEGVSAIRPDPATPGRVYVAVYGENRGLYRSADFGLTWERLLADDYLHDVAVAPFAPGILMAASSSALYSGGYASDSRGVLYSDDDGDSWRAFNEGLAWPFAARLKFQPGSRLLWLAAPGTGYHRRAFPPLRQALEYICY